MLIHFHGGQLVQAHEVQIVHNREGHAVAIDRQDARPGTAVAHRDAGPAPALHLDAGLAEERAQARASPTLQILEGIKPAEPGAPAIVKPGQAVGGADAARLDHDGREVHRLHVQQHLEPQRLPRPELDRPLIDHFVAIENP